MVGKMKIREYKEQDLEDVVSLWNDCELTVSWNDPQKDIARKLIEKPELFLIGEIHGKIIACVIGGYDGHRGSINYLAVSPQYQKLGYGRQLMKEIESRITKLGCPKINIMIRNSNEKVIQFYENFGYCKDPVICMGKRLISDE